MQSLRVRLVNIFDHAFDNFVATARTCYSSRGIVGVEDVAESAVTEPSEIERRRMRKHALAKSLFQAGHHTTLQHTHLQFAIEGISRHCIWSFLHSHPFYNSEQVSQRYVAVHEGNFYLPDSLGERGRKIFASTIQARMRDYQELCDALAPYVGQHYFEIFSGRKGSRRAEVDIRRKAQELARYVLPVATLAYLYHTISLITLFRYYRIAQEFDTSTEQRMVVERMVEALLKKEPEFRHILQEPMPIEDTPEYAFFAERGYTEVDVDNARRFVAEFDAQLGGALSVLVDYSERSETVLAESVREVLGVAQADLSDEEAIRLVLDPAENRILGEAMNLTTLSKLNRTLFHVRYVFRKRLSHAADSQDQRHRFTPGSRPILMRHYTGEPDYYTPVLIERIPELRERYDAAMRDTWAQINRLLNDGESPEDAAYLLPNAVHVRFTESADLLNLHHKMAMRLCYNAQEEIWRACLEEAQSIIRVHPEIGRWLLPPCTIRARARKNPYCPEGDRFCGVTVWRLPREEYSRVL